MLGMPWQYDRRRVDEASFGGELAALEPTVHGLSLTMPLKTLAHDTGARRDAAAEATGAANTLVRDAGGWAAFNTDVGGLARALTEAGVAGAPRARVVGAGATATSAIVALRRVGVGAVDISARRPGAAGPLRELAETMGLAVTVSAMDRPVGIVDLTVSTLPGDAPVPADVADGLAAVGGTLYDVVYGTWPTALAAAWERRAQGAHPGMTMLLHQAVLQVRIFTSGSPDQPLPREDEVIAVMRRTLVGG